MKLKKSSKGSVRTKSSLFASVAIAVLGLAGLTLHVASSKVSQDREHTPKIALTVGIAKPRIEHWPIRFSAKGNIAAWQEAVLSSEISGLRLTEVRVNVGDVVRAGQILAVFASDTIQADVAQARAQLAEAEANATSAAANADRARVLQTSGAMSGQQVSQYLTAEKTANAHTASAKAYLDAQLLRLQQTKLLAPDNGVISSRTASVGAVVAGGVELFRLVRGGRLEWRAELASAELTTLRVGMAADVQAPDGSRVTGRVRMIAPTVEAQTRYGLVYVDLPITPAANGPFKPGMFASGEFDLGTSNAQTLPQQSVVVRDGYSYVFLVNENHLISELKVKTGRYLGDRVEIIDGIEQTQRFASKGAGFLNDGDVVREESAEDIRQTASAALPPSKASMRQK